MVCPTAVLSSSLALSLLRQSAPPSQSFVISPFSLDTALAIIDDGAGGATQKELTNLLLKGCTPSDVTAHYSSLALSLPITNVSGVELKSANRFYINDSISLKQAYETHVESAYKVEVEEVNFNEKAAAANLMNNFVDNITEGKIKQVVDANSITSDTVAMFINAIYFHGDWKYTFSKTHNSTFHGASGDRTMEFMSRDGEFRVSTGGEFGTALLLPYNDDKYNFFIIMPDQSSNLTKLFNSLTGKCLLDTLNNTRATEITVIVPKFRVDSNMDAVGVLKKLGVSTLFGSGADLSKISSDPMSVSSIKHVAVIEVSELGTTAAAATVVGFTALAMPSRPPLTITIDHPFIYGIMKNDDILFIGQFV